MHILTHWFVFKLFKSKICNVFSNNEVSLKSNAVANQNSFINSEFNHIFILEIKSNHSSSISLSWPPKNSPPIRPKALYSPLLSKNILLASFKLFILNSLEVTLWVPLR